MSYEFMRPKDVIRIKAATKYSHLAKVAINILERMPEGKTGMVCGPITTGGWGDKDVNLCMFNAAIITLIKNRYSIFNQMPFENKLKELQDKSGLDYDERILTEFYGPIFESGLINYQYFMHNWRTSKGATWEHEQAKERGIEIVYLHSGNRPFT